MGGCQSSTPNPSGTISCPCFGQCCSAIRSFPVISWFISLDEIERCRLAGVVLSCVATILVTISISTEFWVKRFVRGTFVFRGLWIDCQMGSCASPAEVHMYIVGSIISMLISLVTSYGSVISGTLCFTPLPRPEVISWPWLAIALCFVSGLTGALGLFNYMRFATRESSAYLSWSLAVGWLVVVVHFVAGICYFWASRWEQELLAENFCTSRTLMTLAEECGLTEDNEPSNFRQKNKTADTAL